MIATIFILIIMLCGCALVLNQRLMQILSGMEKSKVTLEDNLRENIETEDDEMENLIIVYHEMEPINEIEKCIEQYKQCVMDYKSLISRQPWKTLAWLLKLPSSGLIS